MLHQRDFKKAQRKLFALKTTCYNKNWKDTWQKNKLTIAYFLLK